MCDQLPSGSVQPTTTNSSRLKHFDLTQIPRFQSELAGVLAKAGAITNRQV